MEDKYNPEIILTYTKAKAIFFKLPEYNNIEVYNFSVFIEIKGSDEWFLVHKDGKEGPTILRRGRFVGADTTISSKIFDYKEEDSVSLFDNKNSLGKVYIKFRWDKIVKDYPNYQEFWNDIKRSRDEETKGKKSD